MRDTKVIISSIVDATIKERQRDTEFLIFRNLQSLMTYVENNPIKAKSLYITAEVITKPTTEFNLLYEFTKNVFFNVDEVIYITTKDRSDKAVFQYLIDNYNLEHWNVVDGSLTRDYISSIIDGSLRTEEVDIKKKALYRVPRDSYVKDKTQEDGAKDDYIDDIKYLSGIEDLPIPEVTKKEQSEPAKLIRIAGLDCYERSLFSYLSAQYLSTLDKTIIIEADINYHRLSDIITKSDVPCLRIDIKELLTDTNNVLDRVSKSTDKLICFIVKDRIKYDYSFIFNLLYNNLYNSVRYFVKEIELSTLLNTNSYTIITPPNVPDILKTMEKINLEDYRNINIIGVNLTSLGYEVRNTEAFHTLVCDVLDDKEIKTSLVNLKTMKIGGQADYDLRSILAIG